MISEEIINTWAAWAKKQPPGSVRNAANTLIWQLRAQRLLPEKDMWGHDIRDGVIRGSIEATFENLKMKIAVENAVKGC